MINPKPQKEHKWLEKFVGEWSSESEGAGPDGKMHTHRGTLTVRSLDGIWYIGESQGEMGPTILTLGFDPGKNRYVGTFIGSMMTDLWVYDGQLDAAGKVLTLDTEGPSFAGDGSNAPYKDSFEFKNDDHFVLTSRMQDKDGNWQEFMTADYKRIK